MEERTLISWGGRTAVLVEGHIEWFTYTGVGDIPLTATHVIVTAKIIRARAFYEHPSIVEVICDEGVERIEKEAFCACDLRRVKMPGVKIIEESAFYFCDLLTDVECGKLEIIGSHAFRECQCLTSIDLSSARIVHSDAFAWCNLTEVKFGSELQRIDDDAFCYCRALERITIPLKDGLMDYDYTFAECFELKHVDLIEVHETIVALHMEEWRNDMRAEIDSINQILPKVYDDFQISTSFHWTERIYTTEKAQAIRTWIRSVLDKIIHYKAEHESVLDDAATALQLALPRDLVMDNVLSFLELPSQTFG